MSEVAKPDWRVGSLLPRLGKLRGRSLRELRERAGQSLAARLEYHRLASTVGEPSDHALWSALDDRQVAGTGHTGERLLAHFRTRESPPFFTGIRDGTTAAAMRERDAAGRTRRLLAAADRAMAGRFDLLGHTGLSFGSPIDWHYDPVSEKRAPRAHWSRIPYLDARVVGDHKVLWEINRHQHFCLLGRAYQMTGRDAYVARVAEHLSSWMDANPPKTGMNWASSLEVALRAIAWLWTLELCRESAALDPGVLQRALKYLYIHGRHLERYLSTYFSPNTHLTGEALGLLYLGSLLPEFHRSERWRQLGWTTLERELYRQVHQDGVYFEQSSYYQRYTADIYLHTLLLARLSSVPVPPPMRERIQRAVSHLADLTRPDGTIPLIGDDDGGRLVALEERSPGDVRSVLAIASAVLDRPELASIAGGATDEALWLLGPDAARAIDAAAAAPPPAHLSRLFPVGGYAIMRDGWGPRANHAVVDCGPLGAITGCHAHSDALGFEITVGGCRVLVDPGTYTYTTSPTDRDAFRHSAAHNTVTVDGHSASVPDGPFAWRHRADAHIELWRSGALVDCLVASHHGFARLPDPTIHRRTVLFIRGGYWVVVDTIEAAGEHEVVAHLHAALGSFVTPLADNAAWIDAWSGARRARLLVTVAGDVDRVRWGTDWVSPAYARRALAPCGRIVSRGTGRRDLITVLVPAIRHRSVCARAYRVDGGRMLVVDAPDAHDVLLLRRQGVVRAPGLEVDADLAWLRRGSRTGEVTAMAAFGLDATVRAGGLTFVTRRGAQARRDASGWAIEGEGRVDTQD